MALAFAALSASALPLEAQRETRRARPVQIPREAPGDGVDESEVQPPPPVWYFDVCVLTDALAGLQEELQRRLAEAFPIRSSRGGQHVRLSNPRLGEPDCPRYDTRFRADVRYQKTRGFPQFSVSGTGRFGASVSATLDYSESFGRDGLGRKPHQASDILRATACLGNGRVIALDLRRIPNWFDDLVMRGIVERLGDSVCIDITDDVRDYVRENGEFPPLHERTYWGWSP